MRRWILVFFCLLLLAGCGAAPQDSPVGEEDGISGAVSLPVTEDCHPGRLWGGGRGRSGGHIL